MGKLILLRHGESLWNKRNLFTGWVDVPLSPKGIAEALEAGEKMKGIPIDAIFTTPLIRASTTAMLAMSRHSTEKTPVILHPGEGKMEKWGKIHSEEVARSIIPVHIAWQLNERMYGDLQGLNKEQMRELYGPEQVQLWRRSYETHPPHGESLEDTAARAIPYFQERILPELAGGKNVLISAHGNSLRALIMHLEGLSGDEVVKLELPTGLPIFYEFKNNAFTRKTEITK